MATKRAAKKPKETKQIETPSEKAFEHPDGGKIVLSFLKGQWATADEAPHLQRIEELEKSLVRVVLHNTSLLESIEKRDAEIKNLKRALVESSGPELSLAG